MAEEFTPGTLNRLKQALIKRYIYCQQNNVSKKCWTKYSSHPQRRQVLSSYTSDQLPMMLFLMMLWFNVSVIYQSTLPTKLFQWLICALFQSSRTRSVDEENTMLEVAGVIQSSVSVNLRTIPDHYPMKNVANFISELNGCTIFSKIDLKSAYWQIPMATDSIAKTVFWSYFNFQ